MTDQELADKIQHHIWKAKRLSDEALRRACGEAGGGCQDSAQAVAPIARMGGHLLMAHADATEAANTMPDVTPQFGGDK